MKSRRAAVLEPQAWFSDAIATLTLIEKCRAAPVELWLLETSETWLSGLVALKILWPAGVETVELKGGQRNELSDPVASLTLTGYAQSLFSN